MGSENGDPNVLSTTYQRQSKRSPVRAFFFMPSQRSPRYGHRSDTCHHEDPITTDPTKVPNSPTPITCVAGVSLIRMGVRSSEKGGAIRGLG